MLLPVDDHMFLLVCLFMARLVSDGRHHTLVNSGIMVTVSLHELLDGILRGLHGSLGFVRDHLDFY